MTNAQIATLLNETLVPNLFGGNEGVTITEDLRNVVDLGTKIADLTADQVKDYSKKFVVGVVNEFLRTATLEAQTFGMYIKSQEYAGIVQRIRSRFTKTYDTPILSLEDYNADSSSPDYNDGHYYGVEFDAKVYTKDSSFMIPYSIPVEMFKKSFENAEGVMSLVSLITNAVDNTLQAELGALAKGILRKIILSASTSRTIPLITTYNTEFGFESGDDGFVTLSNWKNDFNFKLWCQETITRLRNLITEYNTKYNDGTVEIRTPLEDVRTVLLNEFAVALDFANSDIYHNEMIRAGVGDYYTVNYWQNGDTSLLPTIGSGSVHDQIKERVKDAGVGVSDDVVTIDHVVGCLFSRWTATITDKLNKTTTSYVAKGDFNQYFNHVVKSYTIDERDMAIALTLN